MTFNEILIKRLEENAIAFISDMLAMKDFYKEVFKAIINSGSVCSNCKFIHKGKQVNICDKWNINLTKEKAETFFCGEFE